MLTQDIQELHATMIILSHPPILKQAKRDIRIYY